MSAPGTSVTENPRRNKSERKRPPMTTATQAVSNTCGRCGGMGETMDPSPGTGRMEITKCDPCKGTGKVIF